MSQIMRVGMPLEKQRATIVAFTAREDGWLVLCIRWNDFMPYVVWDAAPAKWGESGEKSATYRGDGITFTRGDYCHTIGAAMYQYAHRGGDISVVNEGAI